MKELSIEEKAKAYDGNYKAYTELINRLENVKDAIKKQNYGIAMDILFKPYPQFQVITHSKLKESEDERIRKALLESFNYTNPWDFLNNKGITKGSIVAWIEKQGEQGEIDYDEELKRCKANPIYFFDKYVKVKLKEQKPAWGEDDEKILNLIIARLHSHKNVEAEEYGKDYHWLKSLKDRVQPKQECSEEDENNILFLTSIIEECFKGKEKITLYGDTVCANFTKEDVIDRLKALKERYTWKPSEEQMEALKMAIDIQIEEYGFSSLNTLFEQLKSL